MSNNSDNPNKSDRFLERRKWEDLDNLTYEQARELSRKHQKALATDEAVSGMHFLEYFPDLDTTPEQVNNAVQQAVADGNATLGLVKDAGRIEPVRFSRRRNYNTGTDLFSRGYLIEELLIFPDSKARIFHNVSNDRARAGRMAASQAFLHRLASFVRGHSKEAMQSLEGFRTREPLASGTNAVHNIYLDAADLKTRLKEATLEERIDLVKRISMIDLTLHGSYKGFLATDEGKKAGRMSGDWRRFWIGSPLFVGYDSTIETLEKVLLPADPELSKQLREARMLDNLGKLVNGAAISLMSNPQIKGALRLLGANESRSAEEIGFSMGDHNPGNVMAYKDGVLEFVDFEDCKLAPVTSVLFPRWVRAGVYGADGASITAGESNAEKILLDASFDHYMEMPEAKMNRKEFLAGFQAHKTAFLLQMARRYKKYEKIDADPDRMRALKRYYYSWFVGELEKQGKVNGADDARLDYLNRLFDRPLAKEEMVAVFEKADPAFSYRSELSPVSENLEKKIQDDRKKTVDGYRRKKTLGRMVKAAVVGLVGVALAYFGGKAYLAEKRTDEFRRKIESIEIQLQDKENRLKKGQEERTINQSYEEVKRYYMFRPPIEFTDFLADNRINAWMEVFYPGMDRANSRQGYYSNPKYKEDRIKHPEWHGFMLTALAAEIDWGTLKEGLLATHCTDWRCELGEWFENKSKEIIDSRVKEFRSKHPKETERPLSLFKNQYGTLNSMITALHYVGLVDNWARFPHPDVIKMVGTETYFMRHNAFGLGHHCKGMSGKLPNDMEPDSFGWPEKKRE